MKNIDVEVGSKSHEDDIPSHVKTNEVDGKPPLVATTQVQQGEGAPIIVTLKSKGNSKMDKSSNSNPRTSSKLKQKKKVGVSINQSARLIRRIARLPEKDIREILKVLRKHKCKSGMVSKASKVIATNPSNSSKISNSSVNKEWENWAVLHGGKELADEDVREIGKSLVVHFVGDKNNRFNLLTRERRRE